MKNSSAISAIIYTGISLVISGLFISLSIKGNYTYTEIIGGAIWVFILSMIILMPVIIPLIKKKTDLNK